MSLKKCENDFQLFTDEPTHPCGVKVTFCRQACSNGKVDLQVFTDEVGESLIIEKIEVLKLAPVAVKFTEKTDAVGQTGSK